MGWPQIVIIVSFSIGLALELLLDGVETKQKHSFLGKLIGTAITVWILHMGGFWK